MRLAQKRTNSRSIIQTNITGLVGAGPRFARRRPPVESPVFRHSRADRERRGAGRGQAPHHPRPGPPFPAVARRRHRRLRDPDRRRLCRGAGRRGDFRGGRGAAPSPGKNPGRRARSGHAARPAPDGGRHRLGPAHRAHLPPVDVAPPGPAHRRAVPLWRSARRPGAARSHCRLSSRGAGRALRRAPDRCHQRGTAGSGPAHPRRDSVRAMRCGRKIPAIRWRIPR